ncbi:MAG: 2-oxoacid:acceptor oxidoreductase subunit alpha [Ectothiorhodospiraceae bacterium]|nr:2-oxoacid:acceptor oxidoreductase subunit alpha [Chromatiales bacterium]MCP5157490.1 2-oxoacid:acceptor oxidoreductase subunit alpha [Ectothiorhodospiraceae bacterium]
MEEVKKGGVNDFVVKLANVNGTGSASANGLLMKSIFRMGVPVVGKNFFPSNIQGLPTWYEIRASKDGYLARSGRVDLMVAMNAETYARDLADVSSGGVFLYDSSWPRDRSLSRKDVRILGVPLSRMMTEAFEVARTRILMKNVAYLGVLVALLDIEMDVVQQLLEETFASKRKLIDANMQAIKLGHDYAREHFDCPLEFRVERMDATTGHIVIDGNTAAALGCVYAGATFGAWYPITPSTSLMDAFGAFCKRYRKDPETGRNRYCIVQAEDELAAIGMVIGASWAGARAFTSTSGPGVSLMSEFLGYAYFTEIPVVLFDVQRVGPSTGMPTRTQQGDIMPAAYASHGDTRHVVLFPADPGECFEMAVSAFDLAERLQTPVIVLSDLDIGMNDWMCREFQWDDSYRPDRGKVLDAERLEKIAAFHRYADVDGDGIPYRSLPGVHSKGAYFTRGSGHNARGAYTEDAGEYKEVLDRLRRKSDTAATLVPEPVLMSARKPTRLGVLSVGGCDQAVREALDRLEARGVALDYLRVRAFPFSRAVQDFLDDHDQVFVVEQNRDAQLRSMLLIETEVAREKLHSVLRYDGLPLNPGAVVDGIDEIMRRSQAA